MLIAQISDCHVAAPGQGTDAQFGTGAFLTRAVAHLNALASRPDAVILSGDLVDAGTDAEYDNLIGLLKPLTMPIYPMPGNHDDRDAMRRAFAPLGCLPAEGPLHYTIETFPVRFVLLDSWVKKQSHGELGPAQLVWLDRTLAAQPARPTAVVLHHPPFETGIVRMDKWNLRDGAALAQVIARHAQVERVICGHMHRPIVTRFAGTVLQTCPSTAHQIGLDLVDPGHRLDVVMEPPACLLHRWDGAAFVTHQSYIGDYETRLTIDFKALGYD